MQLMEEDIVFSLLRDLQSAPLTIKDLTGVQERVTDTIGNLFPGIVLYPVRTQDLNADLPTPAIGIAWEDNLAPRYSYYGEASGYQHIARLIVIGTALVAGPNGDLEPDFHRSVQQTLQLRNALRSLYVRDRFVDWYRIKYDSAGTATLFGQFVLRGNPHIMDVDGAHFVVNLNVEVIDQPAS